MLEANNIVTYPVEKARQLFEKLHSEEIVYCHFKGNSRHLQRSLAGESDLDVLFDKRDQIKIQVFLNQLGFKRFLLNELRRMEDVEDYFALDASGILIHLHLHYRINFGAPGLKNYQLGMEREVLSQRVFVPAHNIYSISPEHEFIFFYLRESLQLRLRDHIYFFFKRTLPGFERVRNEFDLVRSGIDEKRVLALGEAILPDPRCWERLLETPMSARLLIQTGEAFKRNLAKFTMRDPLKARFLRWRKEFVMIFGKLVNKFSFIPWGTKRTNPRGGKLVLILEEGRSEAGAMVSELLKGTFGTKLSTLVVQFGDQDKLIGRFASLAMRRAYEKGVLVICRVDITLGDEKNINLLNSWPIDFTIRIESRIGQPKSLPLRMSEQNKNVLVKTRNTGAIDPNVANDILSKVWNVM
jgi:hypothetical protein